jgi:hypothetical protein
MGKDLGEISGMEPAVLVFHKFGSLRLTEIPYEDTRAAQIKFASGSNLTFFVVIVMHKTQFRNIH